MIADLKYVLRLAMKEPGTSLSGIAALALSIGLTSAMLSILYGSFWKSLPLPEAERLVRIESSRVESYGGVEWMVVEAWREGLESLEEVVPWEGVSAVFSGDNKPAEIPSGAYVSAEFFDAVGVVPIIGRGLRPEDDVENAPLSVVLGYRLWMSRYGGDRGIVGEGVKVGGDPATIIGVMPQGFAFPLNEEFWLPLGNIMSSIRESKYLKLDLFGRLKQGVSAREAQAELNLIARHAGTAFETEKDDPGRIIVQPFVQAYTKSNRRPLLLMMGAVLGVLLIGCANVTNLLLARWTARRRELTVRSALGAGRWPLVRQMLADALVLAVLGALVGLGVAKAAIDLYNGTGGLVKAFWVDIRLSPFVLLAVLAVTFVAALLSGLIPALRESKNPDLGMLRDQAHGSTSQRVGSIGEWLVSVQVAISCGLLIATLLMVRSVDNLESADFGEEPDKVWAAQFALDTSVYPGWRDWLIFYEQFRDRLRRIPGVSAVSFASHLPSGRTAKIAVEIEGMDYGTEANLPMARWSVVTPDYFMSLGRTVVEGRDFLSSDTVGKQPVVVINQSFSKRHFQDASPLGRRIRLKDRIFGDFFYSIVGVVPDLYLSWDYFSDQIDREYPEGLYLPAAQHPPRGMHVVIRSEIQAAGLSRTVRDILAEFSPDMPFIRAETMESRIEGLTARHRMVRSAFTVLGMAALLLAAIGIFALVSFIAAQKHREIAIHMALGANPWKVVVLSTGGLGFRAAVGILGGLGLGLLLSRLLHAFLYDVKSIGLPTLAVVVTVLCLMVAVACFAPTRRSVLLDPAVALRGE